MEFMFETIGEFIGMGFGSLVNPIPWVIAIWLVVKKRPLQSILIWPILTNIICWFFIMKISILHMGGPNVSIISVFFATGCAAGLLSLICYLLGKFFRYFAYRSQFIFNKFRIPKNSDKNHDDLYRKAYEEISSGQFEPANWAKSFANAEGNQEKAKAMYIKYRVEQLANLEAKKLQVASVKTELPAQRKVESSLYGDNKGLVVIIAVIGLTGVGLLISQIMKSSTNYPLQSVTQIQVSQPSLTPFEEILQKANEGEADAQNKLCVMYNDGEGTQKNENQALQWCRLAANQGHAAAQHNLSIMYTNGQGIKKDDKEAFYWMKSSAEQGVAISQYYLALMYTNGQGIQKNSIEAAKWYHLAADQGYAAAQNDLGFMYASGEGVPQNYVEALKWFGKSAEQGNALSQYNMGFFYEEGLGVSVDLNKAVYWYQEAVKNGYEEAKKALENFSEIGTTTGGSKIISKRTKVQNPASSTTEQSNNVNDPKVSQESDGTYQIQYSYSNGKKGSISGDLPKVRQQMREELMKRGLHIP